MYVSIVKLAMNSNRHQQPQPGKRSPEIECFQDGSSVERTPGGGMVIRESPDARAQILHNEPSKGIRRHFDRPPSRRSDGTNQKKRQINNLSRVIPASAF